MNTPFICGDALPLLFAGIARQTKAFAPPRLKSKPQRLGQQGESMDCTASALTAAASVTEAEGSARVIVRTPQIHWHGKSPVFAVDFHPHFERLCATGGLEPDGTGGVHLWIVNDSSAENVDRPVSFVQDLPGHEKAVNCLRFCPKGDLLASAGVEGIVIIWRRTAVAPSAAAAVAGHEKWEYMTMLRAQTLDVVDLSWSPSCTQLATASVDNTAAVFNLVPHKEKVAAHIRGHDHFALGVAWDPKEEYILTVSSDGSSRFHISKSRKWKADARTAHIASRMDFVDKKSAKGAQLAEGEMSKGSKEFKMFLDDSMAAHRRRAAWSPDGLFAVVPAGLYQKNATSAPFYVSHVLARRNPTKSFSLLPSGRKPSVAVRFCPVIFKTSRQVNNGSSVRPGVPTPEKLFVSPQKGDQREEMHAGFNLPYRMVFAVATCNSIMLYDTEQMKTPFLYVSGIHFDALTDIAWSKDGQHLIATSKDGYCSMIEFGPGELGEPLETDCLPPVVAKNSMPGKSIDLSIKDPDDEGPAADLQKEETAAQRVAEMVAAPATLPETQVVEFKEMDRVSARWNGGAWFVGIVTKVNEPEVQEVKQDEDIELVELMSGPKVAAKTYAIQFDDGDFDPAVPHDHIKMWEDKRARKRRIVPEIVGAAVQHTTNPQEAAAPAAEQMNSGHEANATVVGPVESLSAAAGEKLVPEQARPDEVTTKEGEEMGNGMDVDKASGSSQAQAEQAVSSSTHKKRRIIPTTIIAPAP
jgi:chromatin assembly factor 1 subunit B